MRFFWRSVRATRVEHLRRLPGDDRIPKPIAVLTHAITIRRPRRDVWPWLAQMGAGNRAGWYSYDRLDNGKRPSATRIIPELQQLKIGMIFPALPNVTDCFTLLAFEPERSLILGWAPTGVPPFVTWTFVLEDAPPNFTRLLVRARASAGYRSPWMPVWLAKQLMPVLDFIMQRKQLLEIAARAEGLSQEAA